MKPFAPDTRTVEEGGMIDISKTEAGNETSKARRQESSRSK